MGIMKSAKDGFWPKFYDHIWANLLWVQKTFLKKPNFLIFILSGHKESLLVG